MTTALEHSIWLSTDAHPPEEDLRKLLSVDGSLWITIDDNECTLSESALCDEVFGASEFR